MSPMTAGPQLTPKKKRRIPEVLEKEDGTRQLLVSGGGTLLAGFAAAALTQWAFGGIGPQGPHTNSGWLSLIVALMCLPFGFLLFLLGSAKWLRKRTLRRQVDRH